MDPHPSQLVSHFSLVAWLSRWDVFQSVFWLFIESTCWLSVSAGHELTLPTTEPCLPSCEPCPSVERSTTRPVPLWTRRPYGMTQICTGEGWWLFQCLTCDSLATVEQEKFCCTWIKPHPDRGNFSFTKQENQCLSTVWMSNDRNRCLISPQSIVSK